MSILKSKHNGWLSDGTRTPFGGGPSGGPQPTQNTTYNTNIPEYARPYVENMLESTQKQIYNADMTGFRPYRPYSTDVNNYFAGFSPLQQQAQQTTAGLQVPGQYGAATNLAGASGLGAFGVAQQAMGAGQQFAQQAQDPRAMQGYMSPYMQNVVDYQKSQALRDYNIARPMRARQAVGQGAFGGNRQAIMEAEAERSLGSQLQGIAATGSQKAFEDAQRQQQFGAQLGMQGLQTGLQGYGQMGQAASTLGQLGGQQLGAQKEIIGLQSQMGREQQALEQNKINQAIQDYAIAQQYPFMQLGMMNAMLRGLPMQTQTTQLYQAQPSALQQGIGLTGAASTLLGGRAAGGAIKEYRQGGIVGYAPGGVIDSTRAKLEQIADMPGGVQKLEQIRNSSTSEEVREMATEIIVQKQMEAQAEQQAQKGRMSGIAMAGGPAFESQGMAGGGIIAFAGKGPSLVEDPEELVNQINLIGSQLDAINKEASSMSAPGSRQKAYKKDSVAEYENVQKRQGELKNEYADLMAKAGLDKPAFNYQPSRSLGAGTTPNPVEQLLSGNKPATTSAMPTEGEFRAFDEATQRFLAEQKAKGSAPAGAPARSPGLPPRAEPSNVVTGIKSLEEQMREQERLMGPNTGNEGLNAKIAERLAGMSKREKQDELAAMRQAFVRLGTEASPGGFLQAATKSIGTYGDASDAARKAREGMDLELTKMQADIKKGERAEKRGNLDAAAKAFESAENRQLRLAEMQNQLKVAGISASRPSDFEKQYALYAEGERAAGRTPTFEGFKKVSSLQDDAAKQRANQEAVKAFTSQEFMNFGNDKKYIELKKAAQSGDAAAVKAFDEYRMQKFQNIRNMMLDPEKAIGGGTGIPQGVTVKKVG